MNRPNQDDARESGAPDDTSAPTLPKPTERLPVRLMESPHPACLLMERLLDQCELRTQRRSGPGGQHRNKTSSGAFLLHRPTEIVAEATERRSQAHNREVAQDRLRYRLAVEIRTLSVFDAEPSGMEKEFRQKYRKTPLKLNDRNADKPAVMAILLNDLHAAGGQPSAVSREWSVSTSSLVNFIKSLQPAFGFVNSVRIHHGRRALK